MQPRYRIEDIEKLKPKYFTDRENSIKLFDQKYAAIGQCPYHALMFYGVGGIGKSSLLDELNKRIERLGAIWYKLDFANSCEVTRILIELRTSLGQKYTIQFPTFDLAYAVYWQKTHPETPLNRNNLTIIDDSEILIDILSSIGHFPILGLVPSIIKVIQGASRSLQEWWTKNGNADLMYLPEMPSHEIVKFLPAYWANDLKSYLESNTRTAVFFIDTYEALLATERSDYEQSTRDEWVRELISNLPRTLWVISGRERLTWEDKSCLTQEPVEDLPEKNALELLQHYGISDENIKARIVEGSCVPYYLILSVDTYQEISKQRQPQVDDFAKTRKEIFTCFIRHLTKAEIEILKVLSSARFWDETLFELLEKEFQTGYPVTALSELCRFSFVYEDKPTHTWRMHQLMRQSFQEHQDDDLKKKVHAFLFKYYSDQFFKLNIKNITELNITALKEAFYHGQIAFELEEVLEWFFTVTIILNYAAEWDLIISLSIEIITIAEKQLCPDHQDLAIALNNLAEQYRSKGRYDEAEPLFRRALITLEKALGHEHPKVALVLNNLACVYSSQGKYDEAEPLHQRSLSIAENEFGLEHSAITVHLNNLALVYLNQGKYDEAEKLFKRSLAILEKELGLESIDLTAPLNNLACLYESQGKYFEAELLYKRSLEIVEKKLGSEHPSVALALINLAGLYKSQGRYDVAEPLCKRSLAIREKVFGLGHPNVATTLYKLANLYDSQGKYDEAEPLYKRSLAIREKTLDPWHPELASELNNLAGLYNSQSRFSEAEPLYQRALEIREKAFGPEHADVAEALNNLGCLYDSQGKYDEAEPLLKRSLAIGEKMLGPEHLNVAKTLVNLARHYKSHCNYNEAEPLYKRALAIWEKLGSEHQNVAKALSDLADIYVHQGKYNEAGQILKRLLESN